MTNQLYHKEKARQLLTFYFRLIAEHAGLKWTNDNYSEINELVDCLIKATQDTAPLRGNEHKADGTLATS